MKNIQDFKKKFDKEINEYLYDKIIYSRKTDERGSDLFKIIKEFVNNGGKRLRPAIFYYSYLSYSDKNLDKILKLSFVFELFHTFILIHDDIIDKSELRRNKFTINKKYGLETAILVGDLALMLADEIFFNQLSDLNLDILQRRKLFSLFNQFKQEIIVGEYLDYLKIDNIQKIMELKTARYSFVRPAILALTLAKVDDKEILSWQQILNRTGILFQIKDDYLGIFGDAKKIGKSVKSDFEEGKNTLIIQSFKKQATADELRKFNEIFGRSKITEKDFIWFIDLLEKKKVKKDVFLLIIEEANLLLKEVNKISIKNKYLTKIIKYIVLSLKKPS